MLKNFCRLAYALLLVLLLNHTHQAQTIFPGAEWQEARPEARGVDAAKLQAAMDWLAAHADRPGDKGLGVQRALVVRDGYVIWKGSDLTTQTPLYSATKSFTSTVLGLLIQDGKCTLDTPVAKHLPQVAKLYPDLKLRHFATMTSGYDGASGERCGQKADDIFDGSSTFFTPAQPVFAPGAKYLYWDDSMRQFINTLSRIGGEKIENFFKRHIADPIGMQSWDWQKQFEVDGMEINGQIQMTAPDLARFGWLFLNRGKWGDKQIINADWVAAATRAQVPATLPLHPATCRKPDGRGVYGFNWWTNGRRPSGNLALPSAPPGTFMALGHNHNFCFVIPEWNMVIVRLGTTERPDNEYALWDTFLSKVSEAVRAGKPAATAGAQTASKPAWPIPDWPIAAPEAVNISAKDLAAYGEWLKGKAGTMPYGTLIIRHGKIAFEQYGGGATADSSWEIGSIRKSVYSALLGQAIREGKLSLDTIVYDVWPEIFTVTNQEKDKRITVRQLATATSGWQQADEPGAKWRYHNLAFSAGHAVIGRVYKLPDDKVAPFVESRIGKQIGARSWKAYHYTEGWKETPGPKLAIDSNLRDLARYGYLWLRGGAWNGQQIIPAGYVREASRNQVAALGAHYGYLWFTNDKQELLPAAPPDAFYHTGSGRPNRKTVLFICPSLDLLALVATDKAVYDIDSAAAVNEWVSKILPAIKAAPERNVSLNGPRVVAKGNFPDLAVDRRGNLHLVYGRGEEIYYRKFDAAARRWEAEEVTGIKRNGARWPLSVADPDVVVDAQGNPHVLAWSAYAHRAAQGWRTIPLSFERDTELAIDARDNVYVIHRGGNNGGFIGAQKRAAGGMSFAPLADPDKPQLGRNDHVYGDLAISPADGALHVVYRHAAPKKTAYRRSDDGGKSWVAQEGITDDEAEGPHIAIGAKNEIYVTDGAGNFFRRTGAGAWSSEGRVVTAERRGQPELAVDRRGNVYVGSHGGRYNVRLAAGGWLGEQTFAPVTGAAIGFVEMAGSDGFAFVVWEEGSEVGQPQREGTAAIVVGRLTKDGKIVGMR